VRSEGLIEVLLRLWSSGMWHCVFGSVVVGDRQYHSDFVINVERSNINDF
jgi:hypothetical protein